MDTVTQIVLGGAVGAAVLGRRLGPRKAAVFGGAIAILPDFDVFYPFDDPVDSFIHHRGPTHSLVIQAAATPIIGEITVRMFRSLRDARLVTYGAVYLCLATHALLDAMTIYGTRLLWPLSREPVGVGSIFIIDPLYTIPLLVAFVWALCLRAWSPRFGRALAAALVLSGGYLAWSVAAQRIATDRAVAVLRDTDVEADRVLATPTPFNTLLWRVIAVDSDRYFNLYIPLLGADGVATVYGHQRLEPGLPCLDDNANAMRLADFSKGFFRVDGVNGAVVVSDLRMGITPFYAFRFVVAELRDGAAKPVPPQRLVGERRAEGDIPWLLTNVTGSGTDRPAEADAIVTPESVVAMADTDSRCG